MAQIPPVILILGAGPNIGQSVGRAFAERGYRVALAARKASDAHNTANEIHIKSDFTDPGAVVNAFSTVKSSLGIPSVVVYNGVHIASRWWITSVFCLPSLFSRCSYPQPSKRPPLAPSRRLQPRFHTQHSQRLCRCATSR